MVLPRAIGEPSSLDPLILLPIPSPLPSSPNTDLDPLLSALNSHLDSSSSPPAALNGTDVEDKIPITALTSAIRQITRKSQILLNASRADVAEARDELDSADSVLRGVEYERERVREEIERCQDYAPEYEALDLPSADHFLAQADESVTGLLPPQDSETYEQALMVARLENELEEITRREALVTQLTKDRDALIKSKKEIKIKFDAVDVHLAGFARSAHAVSSKLKDVADLSGAIPIPISFQPPTAASAQAPASGSTAPGSSSGVVDAEQPKE